MTTASSVTVVRREVLTSLSAALNGQVAGLRVVPAAPGGIDQVSIRGMTTVAGNNEPLYIYNGIPVTAADIAENVGSIQSVTVLRDAAATALYGSRAANGVIVISGTGFQQYYKSVNLSRSWSLPYETVTVEGEQLTTSRHFYAPLYTSRNAAERTDFRETIYWNPVVQTDKNGKATLSFYNSDAITSFRAITEGIGYNGQVGRDETTYVSQTPLSLDVKIPPYLTTGDKALLPVVITNNRKDAVKAMVSMILPAGLKAAATDTIVTIAANGSQRVLFPVEATAPLNGTIVFSLDAPTGRERIVMPVTMTQKGFPVNVLLSASAPQLWNFAVKGAIPGSMNAKLSIYAELEDLALEVITGMLREPHGCFEQTSSTTYPNIFILKYLQQTGKISPLVRDKAMNYLKTGYKLLKSYETAADGFEWFGRTPPQEVLTAYGLMEFTDMKEFIKVDEGMIERTKKFLLKRRDGKGGFLLEASNSYQFRAVPYEVANTYIVYALTKAGMGKEIVPEYEAALKTALKSNSAWQLAVMANAAYYSQRQNDYEQLITMLKQGYEAGTLGVSSVVGATGISLNLETMAWYGLALAKNDKNVVTLSRLIPDILKQRSSYGFGATQSTLLCLELLTAYSQMTSALKMSGKTIFKINESQVSPGILDPALLKEGANTFAVTTTDMASTMTPYDLELNYYTLQPDNNPAAVLKLQTTLGTSQAKVGETVRMNIQVKNETDKGLPMSVAKIGIPAGLSAQPWQLKELIETGKIAHYEVFDNYLVLYWIDAGPGELKIVNLDLKAEIPGTYKGRANNVYLYYMPEAKHWNAGLEIDIRD
nr:alpha-2-macroglobulin family protein [Chitinophaga qingshengii]